MMNMLTRRQAYRSLELVFAVWYQLATKGLGKKGLLKFLDPRAGHYTARMTNPWDQQQNESTKAFQRFSQYHDMEAGRSLRKLAKDLELNASTLAEISSKHNWQERIAAFDDYIDKASQYNQIAQVRAMKRRQIALALRAQKVAEKGLKKILRDLEDDQLIRKLSPEGLSKILDTGCRLERLNRDKPEHNRHLSKLFI
jgi:hypothetical protein